MTKAERQKIDHRAHMFKALAHPMRVFFLQKLAEKSWCVCELAQEAGIPKSAASKHLTQLKMAGFVEDERKGTRVEYRLMAPCVISMMNCAEKAVLENQRKRLGLAPSGDEN